MRTLMATAAIVCVAAMLSACTSGASAGPSTSARPPATALNPATGPSSSATSTSSHPSATHTAVVKAPSAYAAEIRVSAVPKKYLAYSSNVNAVGKSWHGKLKAGTEQTQTVLFYFTDRKLGSDVVTFSPAYGVSGTPVGPVRLTYGHEYTVHIHLVPRNGKNGIKVEGSTGSATFGFTGV